MEEYLYELRADNFAIDLLIPNEQLKQELAKGNVSVEYLAEKFAVSKGMVRFKLKKILSETELRKDEQ